MNTTDLTQRPPRSPRVRLGGFVCLPRMLDKGRAQLAGKNGEYHYDCPLDQRFTQFVGIDATKLLEEVKSGKGDGELLEWILAHATHKRCTTEVAAWSTLAETRTPADVESREFFNNMHKELASKREDIGTWFDLLDVDDFVTFGGKA